LLFHFFFFFFFSSRRRHTRSYGDWSSDVCSSDLVGNTPIAPHHSGGRSVLATPGLRLQLGSAVATYAYFQFRVYERTNGPEAVRSEERRVGKECRCRGARCL